MINIVNRQTTLDALWQSAPATQQRFMPEHYAGLPTPARRYLEHAIAPGTLLASAVRLKMHGEIKLKGWHSFTAEQVICRDRGMIWQATTWMNGFPIGGWDRLIDGEGAMQWKLLGLFPVMKARGNDITRSALGRMQGECIWLPSVFCGPHVVWTAPDDTHAHAHLTMLGQTTEIRLTVNGVGQLERLCFQRWGNPEGGAHHYANFGGFVEAEGAFSGFTIPTQLQVGWYFDENSPKEEKGDRFESDGKFFRVTLDDAFYR